MFLSGVVELFSRYPAEVVERSLDVSCGLPGKHKWWPKVSEIKETLDAIYEPMRSAMAWEAGARRAIAARDVVKIEDQRPRKTMAQHQAELAEHGIFIGGAVVDRLPAERAMAMMGVSQEEWDAIPNARA